MGQVVYFGLCLLGCLIFGSSGTIVEGEASLFLPDASDKKPASKSPCPSQAFYFRQYCYEFFGNSMTWDLAEIACQNHKRGSHLASFSSMREEKIVSAHIKSRSSTSYAWIGLSATPTSSGLLWEWTDGSPYASGSPLWDSRRPSTSTSSYECLMLYNIQSSSSSTRWLQQPCDYSYPYVCKYKPGY
uniref:snaclec purpureotin subunit beta-like n=1 Tax=Euleptes europaea TaxID=460621 RepID=UPI00254122EF|nr:snaclec purpureotin subunit beta-like [Euleptes europaea]